MITIRITTSGETLPIQAERAGRTLARAITAAVVGATEGAKLELRRQLETRGDRLGRLRGAIRGTVYPRPPRYSPSAVGMIHASGEDTERMFVAFSTGPVIVPKRGKALAIPLHNYRDINGRLLGPRSSFFANRLTYISRSKLKVHGTKVVGLMAMRVGGRASSIRRQRNAPRRRGLSRQIEADLVPVFLLVDRAHMPKLLTPDAVVGKWAGMIPQLIEQNLREFG